MRGLPFESFNASTAPSAVDQTSSTLVGVGRVCSTGRPGSGISLKNRAVAPCSPCRRVARVSACALAWSSERPASDAPATMPPRSEPFSSLKTGPWRCSAGITLPPMRIGGRRVRRDSGEVMRAVNR